MFCSEPLASESCVVIECGHLFHHGCVSTYLQDDKASKKAPISITNTSCPLCKAGIKWQAKRYTHFDILVQNASAIRIHLEALSVAQITLDNSIPDMPDNPLEYGMAHFKFYRCNKCSSVYYGGKRECGEDDLEAEEGELLCGGCRGCAKHGDEYMSYKCRYCCKEALWFCFGHTHFCDGCHSNNGGLAGGVGQQYLAKKLDVCGGKDKCPLGIDHPPHGQEFALRCTACIEEVKDEFGAEITALYGPYVERIDALADVGLEMLFGDYAPQLVYGGVLVEDGEALGLDLLFYEDEWLAEFQDFALFDDENDQLPQQHRQPVLAQAPEPLHPALDPQFEAFDIFESPSSLSTTTPSRLNKFFHASKVFFQNWPQFVVVAATAALLNSSPVAVM